MQSILLPIADVSINPFILIFIGFSIGLIAGIYGIGGGVIAVPVLILIGIPAEIAVTTAINQMTAASFSGYLAYSKRKRVDYKLSFTMLTGSIIGVVLGVYMFVKLEQLGYLNLFVKVIFVILLSLISFFSAKDVLISFYNKYRKNIIVSTGKKSLFYKFKIFQVQYISTKHPLSCIFPFILGILGGALTAMTGTSGSLIILPIMIHLLKISVTYLAGSIHLQMIFTTIFATVLHALSAISLDLILSIILIIGTVFGTQIGVNIGARFDKQTYKVTLSILILMLCFKVNLDLFTKPKNPYILEMMQYK